MIAEIRAYLNGVAIAENSDLKANDNPINEDIADTVIEDTFSLEIGNMSTDLLDSTVTSNVSVRLSIYKAGDSDSIGDYDNAYCEAIGIQARAMYKPLIDQLNYIKNVTSSGIEAEVVNNNDNMFKFSIQFVVTVDYIHII